MERNINRTGRKPSTKASTSTSKSSKPTKSKSSTSKNNKNKNNNNQNDNVPLDIYSYSSSVKKPRGDVDPLSRKPKELSKSSKSSKGKGKGKQGSESDEEEDLSEDEEFDEDALMVGPDGIVEFTGVKPAGLFMGGGSDDENALNSEDDEDILSDDAFEDEDDLPLKPKKGKAGKKIEKYKEAEIDLDEEEIDFEDEEGGAYMDASEMLDTGEFDSEDSEVELNEPVKGIKVTKGTKINLNEDSEEDSDDDGSDDEEDSEEEEVDSDEMNSEEDEEYEGALNKLSSYVDGLESKKRKMEEDEAEAVEGGKKKKRIVLKERTEAFPEGEFVAVSAPEGVAENKVNLEDLLASFANSKNPRLAALRKTLKPLATLSETSSTPSTSSHSHLKTPGPLAAPLPGRLQDKIEREAGYEKTKEETDTWNETVRRMKGESGLGVSGAKHERLSLPLMGGGGDVTRAPNAAEWSAKFKANNSLESTIESLLATAQMSTSDLQKAEKSALALLDPADVAARQTELRQQRDLMFRAERKAKRVAKIKSKAFRRIHRRIKGKDVEVGLSLEEMTELDKIDGGDRVVEEKARMEIVRARERVSLKHSTKSGGRWSKTIGGIEGLDEERNTAVRDMVARGDELRKKIAGIESDEEVDEFDSDGSEEDEEDASLDQIRQTAFNELASLDKKNLEASKNAPKVKGVLNMKFMKDAILRGERKVQNSTDELRRKLMMMDEMGSGGGSEEDTEDFEMSSGGMSESVQGNLGRMVFGPSSTSQSASPLSQSTPPLSSISKPVEFSTKLSGPLTIPTSNRTVPNRSPLSLGNPTTNTATAELNPWLASAEDQSSSGKISRKMNKATVGKDSREAVRSANKIDRQKSKMVEAVAAEKDDALVEIDPSIVLTKVVSAPQVNMPTKSNKKGKKAVVEGNSKLTMEIDGGNSSDEDDEESHEAQRGKGPTAFKQRDLVARAFAGDNVVADFEAEKRREAERDAPSEIDNTLPGWGSWSGKGVKKAKNPKKFITKVAGIEPSARQDANYTNVIISEKKDKKASKYLLKDLPFPYTSAAQHEHKLRTPMGLEWSTATILRDQTIPKVLIKPGVTIRPLSKANKI